MEWKVEKGLGTLITQHSGEPLVHTHADVTEEGFGVRFTPCQNHRTSL